MATAPNTLWGMDFVSDALFDGRRFRLLPVLDHFTHECLEIVLDPSLRADDVAEAVARLVAIKVDDGSELAGKVMDRWAYENGVELDFSWLADRLQITKGDSSSMHLASDYVRGFQGNGRFPLYKQLFSTNRCASTVFHVPYGRTLRETMSACMISVEAAMKSTALSFLAR